MSNSSITQPDLFGEERSDFAPDRRPSAGRTSSSGGDFGVEFPSFTNYAGTQAQTTRIAGRMIAAATTEAEHKALLSERQQLLDKFLDEKISRRESIRLEYVRWLLDRIEDAKHGEDLDRLEDQIDRYEHFLDDLDEFKDALRKAGAKHR